MSRARNAPAPGSPADLAGRAAYEADCAKRPHYGDGQLRSRWEQLGDIARWSWCRAVTPSERSR